MDFRARRRRRPLRRAREIVLNENRWAFVEADLERERFAAAAGRAGNQIEGNDFSGMQLGHFEFRRGVDLSRQRLPDGDNYIVVLDARSMLLKVRGELATSDTDNLDLRQGCLRLLDYELEHGIASREHQQWLMWTDDDHNPIDNQRAVRDAVISAANRQAN